jgi:hypothetical protein
MLITVATLALLGLFVLSAHNVMSTNAKLSGQSEHSLTALSLAQSLVDEMKTKSFDRGTVNPLTVILSASSFTAPGSLGGDTLEIVPNPDTADSDKKFRSAQVFNDVDDYRGYTRVVNTARAQGYVVRVDSMSYVDPSDPQNYRNTQTYCKRVDISVICPAIALNKLGNGDDLPIRLSYAFTY